MNLPSDRFGFGAVGKYANLVQVEHAPSPLLAVKAFGEIQAGVLGRFGGVSRSARAHCIRFLPRLHRL